MTDPQLIGTVVGVMLVGVLWLAVSGSGAPSRGDAQPQAPNEINSILSKLPEHTAQCLEGLSTKDRALAVAAWANMLDAAAIHVPQIHCIKFAMSQEEAWQLLQEFKSSHTRNTGDLYRQNQHDAGQIESVTRNIVPTAEKLIMSQLAWKLLSAQERNAALSSGSSPWSRIIQVTKQSSQLPCKFRKDTPSTEAPEEDIFANEFEIIQTISAILGKALTEEQMRKVSQIHPIKLKATDPSLPSHVRVMDSIRATAALI